MKASMRMKLNPRAEAGWLHLRAAQNSSREGSVGVPPASKAGVQDARAPVFRTCARFGFTLIELLAVLVIVLVLSVLLFAVSRSARASANLAKCIGNMRQIGSLVGVYAADHQGEWPFFKAGAPGPDYESTWSGSLTRSGSTPISIAGAVAPYAGENPDSLLFLCPAHSQFVRRFRSKNFAVDATYSSYITRGRNTTGATATMLGKQFGSTAGHAILSCYFMHDPGSNPAYGYTISPHTDKWPVLFGDGHVIVAPKPDWLNLDSLPDVNGSTGQQIKFWRYFDTQK